MLGRTYWGVECAGQLSVQAVINGDGLGKLFDFETRGQFITFQDSSIYLTAVDSDVALFDVQDLQSSFLQFIIFLISQEQDLGYHGRNDIFPSL